MEFTRLPADFAALTVPSLTVRSIHPAGNSSGTPFRLILPRNADTVCQISTAHGAHAVLAAFHLPVFRMLGHSFCF